jgi:hypothetical protein
MAKFMLIKINLMAEITDADTLREAALRNFDDADSTSPDHPETADWHASEEGQEERRSEEGQEERRLIATEDKTALHELHGEPMLPLLRDGVPGAKVVYTLSSVDELEGTTRREARDAWSNREGLHHGPTFLSRPADAKRPEITTALYTASRPARPGTEAA